MDIYEINLEDSSFNSYIVSIDGISSSDLAKRYYFFVQYVEPEKNNFILKLDSIGSLIDLLDYLHVSTKLLDEEKKKAIVDEFSKTFLSQDKKSLYSPFPKDYLENFASTSQYFLDDYAAMQNNFWPYSTSNLSSTFLKGITSQMSDVDKTLLTHELSQQKKITRK